MYGLIISARYFCHDIEKVTVDYFHRRIKQITKELTLFLPTQG